MGLMLEKMVTRPRVSPLEPAIGSIFCVLAAVAIRLALTKLLGNALPFATFFPAVIIVTLFWGHIWGIAAATASIASGTFIFARMGDYDLSGKTVISAAALFTVSCLIVLFVGHVSRRALILSHNAEIREKARKAELQHRMKNTIMVVQAFSFFLSRKAGSVKEYHAALDERMFALVKASEALFSEEFLACPLRDIAIGALSAFSHDGRIEIEGPDVTLEASCAEPLALALHELATNAHKYGSLSVPSGTASLSWELASDNLEKCRIVWLESGGPPVAAPERMGMGRMLLKPQGGLQDVKLTYEPTGLLCELTVSVCKSTKH